MWRADRGEPRLRSRKRFYDVANGAIPVSLAATQWSKHEKENGERTEATQVGTASPAFGSRDLVYHPYPGNMVRARTTMEFIYVSLDERREVGLAEMVRLMEA